MKPTTEEQETHTRQYTRPLEILGDYLCKKRSAKLFLTYDPKQELYAAAFEMIPKIPLTEGRSALISYAPDLGASLHELSWKLDGRQSKNKTLQKTSLDTLLAQGVDVRVRSNDGDYLIHFTTSNKKTLKTPADHYRILGSRTVTQIEDFYKECANTPIEKKTVKGLVKGLKMPQEKQRTELSNVADYADQLVPLRLLLGLCHESFIATYLGLQKINKRQK